MALLMIFPLNLNILAAVYPLFTLCETLTGFQYNNRVISREVVGNKVYNQSNMCEEDPCSKHSDADIDNALWENRQFESLALEAANRNDEKRKTIGTNNNGTTMKYTIQTKTMPCCR